jgi:hypothetical protein
VSADSGGTRTVESGCGGLAVEALGRAWAHGGGGANSEFTSVEAMAGGSGAVVRGGGACSSQQGCTAVARAASLRAQRHDVAADAVARWLGEVS